MLALMRNTPSSSVRGSGAAGRGMVLVFLQFVARALEAPPILAVSHPPSSRPPAPAPAQAAAPTGTGRSCAGTLRALRGGEMSAFVGSVLASLRMAKVPPPPPKAPLCRAAAGAGAVLRTAHRTGDCGALRCWELSLSGVSGSDILVACRPEPQRAPQGGIRHCNPAPHAASLGPTAGILDTRPVKTQEKEVRLGAPKWATRRGVNLRILRIRGRVFAELLLGSPAEPIAVPIEERHWAALGCGMGSKARQRAEGGGAEGGGEV